MAEASGALATEVGASLAGGWRRTALRSSIERNPAMKSTEAFFGGQSLNDLPAALELIDLGDEHEDFVCDRDVLDVVHGQYPFTPIYTRFIAKGNKISICTRL
jgi:hypothetical protein